MTTHANPCGAATTWVVSGRTHDMSSCLGFLGDLFSFFYFSSILGTEHCAFARVMIYMSYDVFLHMDVPFGGPVVDFPQLGDQIPQNSNFGGLNRHFQAKCTKY